MQMSKKVDAHIFCKVVFSLFGVKHVFCYQVVSRIILAM